MRGEVSVDCGLPVGPRPGARRRPRILYTLPSVVDDVRRSASTHVESAARDHVTNGGGAGGQILSRRWAMRPRPRTPQPAHHRERGGAVQALGAPFSLAGLRRAGLEPLGRLAALAGASSASVRRGCARWRRWNGSRALVRFRPDLPGRRAKFDEERAAAAPQRPDRARAAPCGGGRAARGFAGRRRAGRILGGGLRGNLRHRGRGLATGGAWVAGPIDPRDRRPSSLAEAFCARPRPT